MSFLNNISSALSNPFVRQIAGGVAGLAKGAQGVQAVDKGFQIFDELMSAFGQGPATNTTDANQPAVSLQDPRDVLGGMDMAQQTASARSESRRNGGAGKNDGASRRDSPTGSNRATGKKSDAMSQYNDLISTFSTGKDGLSSWQTKLLRESGLDPDSQEYKSQVMQMKISNMSNMIQALSNIAKMIADTQRGIINNIRA